MGKHQLDSTSQHLTMNRSRKKEPERVTQEPRNQRSRSRGQEKNPETVCSGRRNRSKTPGQGTKKAENQTDRVQQPKQPQKKSSDEDQEQVENQTDGKKKSTGREIVKGWKIPQNGKNKDDNNNARNRAFCYIRKHDPDGKPYEYGGTVMFIMCNPSLGGNPDEQKRKPEVQSDKTLNMILRAADANMFGKTNYGNRWTGVHIRNLFTLRSSDPKDVVDAFQKHMNEWKEKNKEEQYEQQTWIKGTEKYWLSDQTKRQISKYEFDCRDYALNQLQVGSDFDEWIKTAEDCEKVIVAWGDCGRSLVQWSKNVTLKRLKQTLGKTKLFHIGLTVQGNPIHPGGCVEVPLMMMSAIFDKKEEPHNNHYNKYVRRVNACGPLTFDKSLPLNFKDDAEE